jgi:hypothetical protein
MLGRRMLEHPVDHTGPVVPGGYRKPTRHRGRLKPAELLHPPGVQFQVRAARGQRFQAALRTPGEIAAQIRLGVLTGRALEAAQIRSGCQLYRTGRLGIGE